MSRFDVPPGWELVSGSELPKPLDPSRKWGTVHHLVHGVGYFLQDETDKGVCTLWNLNKNSGMWTVWVHDRPVWMTGRTIVDLGPHDEPPFELAEAVADAAR